MKEFAKKKKKYFSKTFGKLCFRYFRNKFSKMKTFLSFYTGKYLPKNKKTIFDYLKSQYK